MYKSIPPRHPHKKIKLQFVSIINFFTLWWVQTLVRHRNQCFIFLKPKTLVRKVDKKFVPAEWFSQWVSRGWSTNLEHTDAVALATTLYAQGSEAVGTNAEFFRSHSFFATPIPHNRQSAARTMGSKPRNSRCCYTILAPEISSW